MELVWIKDALIPLFVNWSVVVSIVTHVSTHTYHDNRPIHYNRKRYITTEYTDNTAHCQSSLLSIRVIPYTQNLSSFSLVHKKRSMTVPIGAEKDLSMHRLSVDRETMRKFSPCSISVVVDCLSRLACMVVARDGQTSWLRYVSFVSSDKITKISFIDLWK